MKNLYVKEIVNAAFLGVLGKVIAVIIPSCGLYLIHFYKLGYFPEFHLSPSADVNVIKFLTLSVLIAPFLENLFLLIVNTLHETFNLLTVIPCLIVMACAYSLHGSGYVGLSSAIFFGILYLQVQYQKEKLSLQAAYYLSVITHSSANLLTLMIVLIR